MKKIIGLAVIVLGVFLEVIWLRLCFEIIIIGILLLIFLPSVVFFPFSFFLTIALNIISGKPNPQAAEFKYQQYSRKSKKKSYNASGHTLSDYYVILESTQLDEFDVIKNNYRRLIKQYHYDSIASKNLPEDMLKFAEQKTQILNEAYSAIKEARGK